MMPKRQSLDAGGLVGSYLGARRWETRENANLPFSFSSVFYRVAGEAMAEYALSHVYSRAVAEAHRDGDVHIHNMAMPVVGYCAGWSLKLFLHEGFGAGVGRVQSGPPQHLDSALLQMANFLGTIQNEWSGAQAFNAVNTYLAPFVRRDQLSFDEVKQAVQNFIFNLNIGSRWGGQTPFTNVTLDLAVPPDMVDEPVLLGGELHDTAYGEFQAEADLLNRAFIEVYGEGDHRGRPFTFPIPTYNVTPDFDWDSETASLLFDMTAKYGLPYFANFVSTGLNVGDVRSMCCRLRLDLRELRRNLTGGLFGASDQTGSVGVVTINMPRLGYVSSGEDDFLSRLDALMELARDALELKRGVVQANIDRGLLPYSARYLGTLRNHFATIGLVGMNEACLNLFGEDIASERGKAFALRVLRAMLRALERFQEETGHFYNLEATPAEGASYRLARLDKARFPDIVTAGEAAPFYTNSTQLPVDKTNDVIGAIEHQEELQALYTGGTVLHVFLGERMHSGEACKRFVRKVMENSRLPCLTITPTYSVCASHGYLDGEQPRCPRCGATTEVYSRVVGYYRPVVNWNDGKQEEFRRRRVYET